MTPKEILGRAADEIRKRGWCRGKVEDSRGRVCLYGAINCAYGGHPDVAFEAYSDRNYIEARETVAKVIGVPSFSEAIVWNNEKTTNKKAVIAALEKAATKCEGT